MRGKVTIHTLNDKVKAAEKITMLTAYDYPMARLEEKAEIDVILCGDSMAMTVFGHEGTLKMTMDPMIMHSQAVRLGAPTAFLVGDMPYMSYQISPQEAIRHAGRFMAEAGCDAVKLEGGADMAPTVEALVKAGIPVMGHLGLTPQYLAQLGGFKSQGRQLRSALKLVDDARRLEDAGITLLLLEALPPEVAKIITDRMQIPVIGIGAGPYVHGQLMIVHDALGFFDAFTPKFVKKYLDLNTLITQALGEYRQDVVDGTFPAPEQCYTISEEELAKIMEAVDGRKEIELGVPKTGF
ncbi:MAG: 3-methyl-2-oxobutanoate hydroxymethyltransferase [Peptococcaceae bacterium]|nr:3-methyl-2-oxobutanoate hydroxymethyltransferase [Peptococcaceae bacterium]